MIFSNFRIIDEETDFLGTLVVEGGCIQEILPGNDTGRASAGDMVIDGGGLESGAVLMPAFVELHAHFRDPGYPARETLESGSLAAAAGGYGTVVCMGNTNPALDTAEIAGALKARSDALGLVDLYPVVTLTKGMAGKELSGIQAIPDFAGGGYRPRLLSEDGRDVADDGLFLAALKEARRIGVPVSCHCDFGGAEAAAARAAGKGRGVWSRIEENAATRRAIALGKEADCGLHIAHVSTKEAVELIQAAKDALPDNGGPAGGLAGRQNVPGGGFVLTCEATPHHLALTEERAAVLGAGSYGRVNPPLRKEEDRQALIAAILNGTVDAIATDHAPHTEADKAEGAPGFTGLETAFAVCRTELVRPDRLDLSRLSALMSAAPARILGLADRGRIAPGLRADLVIAAPDLARVVTASAFRSRGKNSPWNNSPYIGTELRGAILMTLNRGRIVFDAFTGF
jgi:dihydroorotase